MLSSTLVSCRHRMSGCCSPIRRSTSAVRARTEFIFHEAIFSRLLTSAAYPDLEHKKKAPAPGAWSEGRPSVRHARDSTNPGNRGKPRLDAESDLYIGAAPDIAMNGSQSETFLTSPFLRLGVRERTIGHPHIVPHVGQFHGRSMVLRIDRGPAVELQPTRGRRAAEERKSQLSVLRRIPRSRDHHARIAAGQDLGLAVEIRRARQQRTERGAAERHV